MTNLMMLLTYGVCSVFLFRLLRHALGSERLAWMWAAVAMLTLPTTAFAFQLYPELPALLIILAVSNELLFAESISRVWLRQWPARRRVRSGGFTCGFCSSRCVWPPSPCSRETGRARWAFLVAFGLLVFSVMTFNYHVTGSWWPTALWDVNGRASASTTWRFVLNAIGYALDRRWGLLPHSLLLLVALPGLFVLGRESAGMPRSSRCSS